MVYTFPDEYPSLQQFLDAYVYKRLVIIPAVIMVTALVVILILRVRGEAIVRYMMGPKPKYYDRVHYLTLRMVILMSLGSIIILIIVGSVLNANVTTDLNNVVDDGYDAVQHTTWNAVNIQNNLAVLADKCKAGFNGTDVVGDKQDILIGQIDGINSALQNLSATIANFSIGVVAMAANYSEQAREIIQSLQSYSQLTGQPSTTEVPIISPASINSQFSTATSAISNAQSQLASIRGKIGNMNIHVDLSGAVSGINSAIDNVGQVFPQLADVNNTKSDVKGYVHKYNAIRMAAIFTSYVVPLLIVLIGLLGILIRSGPVIRVWFHLLLVGAGISAAFAAIYMVVPIIINDVCDSPHAVVFTTIHSVDKGAANTTWYRYFSEYFPILSECNATTYFIQYVNISDQVDLLLDQSANISAQLSFNYTKQISDATDELDQGIDNLQDVDISLVNSTSTKEKLENVRSQLSNLTKFGFSQEQYDDSLQAINDLTASIPVNSGPPQSIYYTSTNISVLDIHAYPYDDTSQSYQNNLQGKLDDFNQINNAYQQALATTAQIGQNITRLESMIDSMDQAARDLITMEVKANHTRDDIHARAIVIDGIVANLTSDVSGLILPQLDDVNLIWSNITNLTSCGYVGDVYREAQDLVCVTGQVSSVAYVTTQLVAAAILCVLNFAANFAWISFRRPYKPFYSKDAHPPADTMVPIEDFTKEQSRRRADSQAQAKKKGKGKPSPKPKYVELI